jgi:hypothetical protein
LLVASVSMIAHSDRGRSMMPTMCRNGPEPAAGATLGVAAAPGALALTGCEGDDGW